MYRVLHYYTYIHAYIHAYMHAYIHTYSPLYVCNIYVECISTQASARTRIMGSRTRVTHAHARTRTHPGGVPDRGHGLRGQRAAADAGGAGERADGGRAGEGLASRLQGGYICSLPS